MSIGRALVIIEGPERLKGEKEEKIRVKLKINKISKMNLKEYIEHKNGKDKDENKAENEDEDEEDTVMDEIEKKSTNLKKFTKIIKKLNILKVFKTILNVT